MHSGSSAGTTTRLEPHRTSSTAAATTGSPGSRNAATGARWRSHGPGSTAGDAREALAILEERLKLPLRRDLNPDSALARGRALLEVGRIAESTVLLKSLQDHWRGSLTPDSPYAAEADYWLGRAYVAAGDPRGRALVTEAKRTLAGSPLASHRKLAAGG